MAKDPQIPRGPVPPGADFSLKIGSKEQRKLRAQRDKNSDIWRGLGMMGMIGWTVALSCLLGTAIGMWIDKHCPSSHSWTLMLLFLGLLLGSYCAWYWVVRESKATERKPGNEELEEEHDGKP